MSDFDAESLPAWAVAELRRPVDPVATSGARRSRIMDLVRVTPAPRRRGTPAFHPRWFRRGALSPVGAALAAGLAGVMTVGSLPFSPGTLPPVEAEAIVVGDTVVTADPQNSFTKALCDTLRIVRFVLRAPGASRVALTGDFNAWKRAGTPLVRDEKTGAWVARIAVSRKAMRYAFVVDNARWVGAPPFSMSNNAPALRVDSI